MLSIIQTEIIIPLLSCFLLRINNPKRNNLIIQNPGDEKKKLLNPTNKT